MHVKKGDKVIVIAGKDKGKTGVIARALPSISKVVIDGINVAKKAIKKTRSGAGKMVEVSMPIHSSNVKLADKTAKVAKVEKKVVAKAKSKTAETKVVKAK